MPTSTPCGARSIRPASRELIDRELQRLPEPDLDKLLAFPRALADVHAEAAMPAAAGRVLPLERLARTRGGRSLGWFVRRDVVVLSFPFSDLTQTKRRPALVIAETKRPDLILCQITSHARTDEYSVPLESTDFDFGGLNQSSRIRPNRLFTADSGIIHYRAGQVSQAKLDETVEKLVRILRQR